MAQKIENETIPFTIFGLSLRLYLLATSRSIILTHYALFFSPSGATCI